jgi:iron complex transport system substrate-binding protein
MPRIVSFLPAGTEIAAALGARDQLVGRSHECDYPADVRELPIVSRPALALDGLSQSEIDEAVATKLRSGDSLYVVDEQLLRELAPDVILTQDLCQVCAPSGNELTRAVTSLPSKPVVVYLSPRTLAEIDDNILAVGEAIGRASAAHAIVSQNHARMDAVRERVARLAERPRVTFL